MPQIELSLLVLISSDMVKTLSFYKTIGLQFSQECHGQGVVHYACTLDTTTIEIYPESDAAASSPGQICATRLGFKVVNIDAVLVQLQNIGESRLPSIQSTLCGRRVVLIDPDGRKVELTEF